MNNNNKNFSRDDQSYSDFELNTNGTNEILKNNFGFLNQFPNSTTVTLEHIKNVLKNNYVKHMSAEWCKAALKCLEQIEEPPSPPPELPCPTCKKLGNFYEWTGAGVEEILWRNYPAPYDVLKLKPKSKD